MTAATHRPAPATLWAAFASLIPWAAFLLAAAVADRSTSPGGLLAAAPAYLGFVALPSAAPLVAARTGLLRLVTATVMTAVAAGAGLFLGTSDDAQAGLAVLWVPLVAIPLATVLWVGNRIADRRATTADPEQPIPTVADRVAALVIDSAILGAVLVVPLTAMSHAQQEVAAGVVGIGVGALYMATLVVARGQTLGQRLLRLAVVDSHVCPSAPPQHDRRRRGGCGTDDRLVPPRRRRTHVGGRYRSELDGQAPWDVGGHRPRDAVGATVSGTANRRRSNYSPHPIDPPPGDDGSD